MKIDIETLIKESGENMTKSSLAQEMYKFGLFKSRKSAINMLAYHQSGKAKSCDYALLKYLVARFNRKGSEILTWND